MNPDESPQNRRETSIETKVVSSVTTAVSNDAMDDIRTRLQEAQSLLEDMTVEKERLSRENRRLCNAVKNAEDRVRSSLQVIRLLFMEPIGYLFIDLIGEFHPNNNGGR